MTTVAAQGKVYAGLVRRGLAYLVDCAVAFGIFAGTQLVLFKPVRGILGVGEAWFHSGVNTQLYTLATISLPVWLYFALFEQSRWQATPGKRMIRLRVVGFSTGGRIGFGRAMVRTVVKLVPWELVHLSNNLPEPIWYASEPSLRPGFAVAGVVLLAYLITITLHRREQGPHDLIAGTLVVRGRTAS